MSRKHKACQEFRELELALQAQSSKRCPRKFGIVIKTFSVIQRCQSLSTADNPSSIREKHSLHLIYDADFAVRSRLWYAQQGIALLYDFFIQHASWLIYLACDLFKSDIKELAMLSLPEGADILLKGASLKLCTLSILTVIWISIETDSWGGWSSNISLCLTSGRNLPILLDMSCRPAVRELFASGLLLCAVKDAEATASNDNCRSVESELHIHVWHRGR